MPIAKLISVWKEPFGIYECKKKICQILKQFCGDPAPIDPLPWIHGLVHSDK